MLCFIRIILLSDLVQSIKAKYILLHKSAFHRRKTIAAHLLMKAPVEDMLEKKHREVGSTLYPWGEKYQTRWEFLGPKARDGDWWPHVFITPAEVIGVLFIGASLIWLLKSSLNEFLDAYVSLL